MWQFGDQDVATNIVPLIDMWQMYNKGILPYSGGWADQPLRVLALIGAVDMVYVTVVNSLNKDFDYKDFTVTQVKLLSWLEKNRN